MKPAKRMSQCGQRSHFDVIVIGAGLAGISYILTLLEKSPQLKIGLFIKTRLNESNSRYAQGGIAASSLDKGSLPQHIEDTLKAGDGLSNPSVVQALLERGDESLSALIKWGVQFDKVNGEYVLAQEGGHSQRCIYHAGDYTGQEIMRVLVQKIQESEQVKIFESHTAVNLITQDYVHVPGAQNEVLGAYILDDASGLIHTCLSKAVVLATGGAGKVYRYTSNPDIATGDGVAMAYRAGARVGNLEFYQFHPSVLYHPKLNNFLITEALRGEGAYLRNADTLERFMSKYAPEQMELATRDIVSRAIFTEIEHSEKNFVYLDIRHKDEAFLQQHFPMIYQTLLELGINMATDMIPVVPAAHYMCGGVVTDVKGRTDIQRLYAIGETAFTGLHGANRLASNSLLEAIVMGRAAAEDTPQCLEKALIYHQPIEEWNSSSVIDLRRASQINAHWRGLRGEMTSYAGIVRTEAGLRDLLRLIKTRREMIEAYYWRYIITRDLVELRNIALVAELMVRSALNRRESRGGHFREDYPNKNKQAKESILLNRGNENLF